MDKKIVPSFAGAMWPGIIAAHVLQTPKIPPELLEQLKKEIIKEILDLLKPHLTASPPIVIAIPGEDWELVE